MANPTRRTFAQIVKETNLPSGIMTAKEAIQEAKLNWEVKQYPAYYKDDAGKFHAVDCRFDTVNVKSRNGKTLGTVGGRYVPIQNVDVFNFFDEVVRSKKARYTAAGELQGGRMVWLQAKMDDLLILKNDIVERTIVFVTSHDGTLPLSAFFTPKRIVCTNQLTRVNRQISIRHTMNSKSKEKISEAQRVFGLALNFYERFEQEAKAMTKIKMDKNGLREYFGKVLDVENIKEELPARKEESLERFISLTEKGQGTEISGVRGTLWGAYNAVTEFADHHAEVQGEEDDPSNRIRSSWMGSGSRLKEKALNAALELVSVRN
jgi:phage/plasmid-like protein (TIGR03299 family)